MRILCVICFILPTALFGQTDTVYVKQWDVVRGIDATIYTFTSPVRWKGKDWARLGTAAAGAAAISLFDKPIRNFMQSGDSKFMDGFERVGYHYGKPYSAVAITGGVYFVGVILKNDWAKETGLMLASTLTTSSVITGILKNGIGRARPSVGAGQYEIDPFNETVAFHSLPSGHSTVAFSISMVLARQVQPVPLKILFYSLAACTGISRLYADAHWTSDVAMGGTIAWFCADAAFKRLQQNRFRRVVRQKETISVSLYPYPGGVSLRANFN